MAPMCPVAPGLLCMAGVALAQLSARGSSLSPAWFAVECGALFATACGAVGAPQLCETFGRRAGVATADACFLAGGISAMAVPAADWGVVAFRLLCGLGVGVSRVAVPLLLSELCPFSQRSVVGSWQGSTRVRKSQL